MSDSAVKLAPSILAADFSRLGAQVLEAERAGADRIHIDVMDGHFVPNLSMGPPVVRSLRHVTRLSLETHLMITEPDRYLELFVGAGSSTLIVHQEASVHLNRSIHHIKSLGIKAGVAINPATPAGILEEIIGDVDLVLVMTVNPGFGGQAFLESTLPKIRKVREMIDSVRPGIDLLVDGGIEPDTAPKAASAGARVLVAGTAIFHHPQGIAAGMAALRAGLG